MTSYIANQKGVALVMALILAVISLAFTAALIYTVSRGTKISGMEKKYTTALAASKGGLKLATMIMDSGGLDPSGIATVPNTSCLTEKLSKVTSDWVTTAGFCENEADPAHAEFHNPKLEPDITMQLSGPTDTYDLFIKIIATIPGNSPPEQVPSFMTGGTGSGGGGGSGWRVHAVVENVRGGVVVPMHMPYLYTVEVLAENNDPMKAYESARITFLYAH